MDVTGMHTAGPVSSAAIHAALTRLGFHVFEATIGPGARCGAPACGESAEQALFVEFQPGDRACPFPACDAHLPAAAAFAFRVFGNFPATPGRMRRRFSAVARRVGAW